MTVPWNWTWKKLKTPTSSSSRFQGRNSFQIVGLFVQAKYVCVRVYACMDLMMLGTSYLGYGPTCLGTFSIRHSGAQFHTKATQNAEISGAPINILTLEKVLPLSHTTSQLFNFNHSSCLHLNSVWPLKSMWYIVKVWYNFHFTKVWYSHALIFTNIRRIKTVPYCHYDASEVGVVVSFYDTKRRSEQATSGGAKLSM